MGNENESVVSWGTTETSRLAAREESSWISSPPIATVPESGSSAPLIARRSVVFPAPSVRRSRRTPRLDREGDGIEYLEIAEGERAVLDGDRGRVEISMDYVPLARSIDSSHTEMHLPASEQKQEERGPERRRNDADWDFGRPGWPPRDRVGHDQKRGPARALVGKRIRWSGPTSSRMMCGTTSPTKPITPVTATRPLR